LDLICADADFSEGHTLTRRRLRVLEASGNDGFWSWVIHAVSESDGSKMVVKVYRKVDSQSKRQVLDRFHRVGLHTSPFPASVPMCSTIVELCSHRMCKCARFYLCIHAQSHLYTSIQLESYSTVKIRLSDINPRTDPCVQVSRVCGYVLGHGHVCSFFVRCDTYTSDTCTQVDGSGFTLHLPDGRYICIRACDYTSI
jgi:hypothetical protein